MANKLLFYIICFCMAMKSIAQVYPGARRVSVRQKNITFENVFQKVYAQTGMTAFYNDEQLSSLEVIPEVSFQDEPLDNVLARLLRKRRMAWCYRKDVFVIAFRKPGDVDLGYLPEEDKRTITGTVVNEIGVPLDAVTVMTQDKAIGKSMSSTGEAPTQDYPGTRLVSIQGDSIRIRDFMELVWQQARLQGFYRDDILNSNERISINVQNKPLDSVLALLLKKRGLEWHYREGAFLIVPVKRGDAGSDNFAGEDKRIITGLVVNDKQLPLQTANITSAGKNVGTTTGKDGRFRLQDVEQGAKLIVRRAGYKQMVLSSYADSVFIQLIPIVAHIAEVKVPGGVQSNLTGSVNQVKGSEIAEAPVNNVLGALQGRVPGLYLNQTTGLPGGGYRIRLRGRNSIESNSDPMILVDGIPFPSVSFNESFFNLSTTTGSNVAANPLNLLSVNDIASIQILKDADATALYGTRGANGIILINSKQPDEHSKGITATVNYYTGIGKASNLVRYLDTKQYLQMRKEAIRNDNRDADSTNDYDLLVWDTTRYKDWQKEMIGSTARITDGSIELKGGRNNFAYRASGTYREETTVYPSEKFRYNKTGAMLQLWFSSRDRRLTVNLSGSFVADRNRLPITDLTIYSAVTPPNAPDVYTADNKLNFAGGTFLNPYAYMLQTTNAASSNFRPNLNIAWTPVGGLTVTANIGGSSIARDETQRSPALSFSPSSGVDYGIAQFFNNRYRNGLADLRVNWKKTAGKEQFLLIAGSRFQFEGQLKKAYYAWGYGANDMLLEDTATAEYVMKLDSAKTDVHYQSYYARFEYKHADRYILTITGSRDGSTRLGRRYGNFGAIGAAWVFTRENWLKAGKLLSYGKLRASYGITGNDQYERDLDRDAYVPGPVFSQRGIRSGKSDYSWEKIRKAEVAIDLGLFNDQLSATLCYYNNRSTDQLLTGRFQTFVDNAPAEIFLPVNVPSIVENKGFEIDVQGVLFRSSSVTWSTNINLSFPTNKLVYFPFLEQSKYRLFYSEGMSLDAIKGYHLKGVDRQTGVYTFVDKGNSGLSRLEDGIFGKEKGPFLYGGWYNNLRYHNFEISCLFRYTKQNNDDYQYFEGYATPPGGVGNQPLTVTNRWQKPGDVATLQQYTTSINTPAGKAFGQALFSDQRLTAANYLRLQSLVLAYRLSLKRTNRRSVKSCKLYLQGLNLFTLTSYNGRDPEVAAGPDSYPSLRVIAAGVQLSL